MEVQIRETCDMCEAGVIQNPAWTDFLATEAGERYAAGGRWTDEREAEFMDWWKARGYSRVPTEEIQCPDCEGSCYRYRWVKLRELRLPEELAERPERKEE